MSNVMEKSESQIQHTVQFHRSARKDIHTSSFVATAFWQNKDECMGNHWTECCPRASFTSWTLFWMPNQQLTTLEISYTLLLLGHSMIVKGLMFCCSAFSFLDSSCLRSLIGPQP